MLCQKASLAMDFTKLKVDIVNAGSSFIDNVLWMIASSKNFCDAAIIGSAPDNDIEP